MKNNAERPKKKGAQRRATKSSIPGVSDEAWERQVERTRSFAFLARTQWPRSWSLIAEAYKRAADHVYAIARDAEQRVVLRALAEGPAGGHSYRAVIEEEALDLLDTRLIGVYYF